MGIIENNLLSGSEPNGKFVLSKGAIWKDIKSAGFVSFM